MKLREHRFINSRTIMQSNDAHHRIISGTHEQSCLLYCNKMFVYDCIQWFHDAARIFKDYSYGWMPYRISWNCESTVPWSPASSCNQMMRAIKSLQEFISKVVYYIVINKFVFERIQWFDAVVDKITIPADLMLKNKIKKIYTIKRIKNSNIRNI
jgi:hypothetical protein